MSYVWASAILSGRASAGHVSSMLCVPRGLTSVRLACRPPAADLQLQRRQGPGVGAGGHRGGGRRGGTRRLRRPLPVRGDRQHQPRGRQRAAAARARRRLHAPASESCFTLLPELAADPAITWQHQRCCVLSLQWLLTYQRVMPVLLRHHAAAPCVQQYLDNPET